MLARTLAERLAIAIPGASFVVENRPGGAAVVGTLAAATAAPDGYTLALGNNQTHAANAAMVRDLPYRPVEDFSPIGRLAEVHHALVVPATSPARTLAALAARGKGGGRLTYASSGVGSASHVIAESFVRREGLEATHVPYRGGAQATTDTVAGTVDFFVSTWPQVVALVQDGRLRCLGIGAPARLAGAAGGPDLRRGGRAVHGRAMPGSASGRRRGRRPPSSPGCRTRCRASWRSRRWRRSWPGCGFTPAPLPAAEFAAFHAEEGVARWRDGAGRGSPDGHPDRVGLPPSYRYLPRSRISSVYSR